MTNLMMLRGPPNSAPRTKLQVIVTVASVVVGVLVLVGVTGVISVVPWSDLPHVMVSAARGGADQALDRAAAALARGDATTAIRLYRDLARQQPRDAAVRFGMARSLLWAWEFQPAEEQFLRAREFGHPWPQVAPYLAEVLFRQAKFAEVLAMVPATGLEAKVGAQVELFRGASLLALGKLDEAERTLRASLADTDRAAPVLVALSRVSASRGEYAAAVGLASRAVELDPMLGDGFVARGQAERMLGDDEAARRSFEQARKVEPWAMPGPLGLAAVLIDAERFDDALEVLRLVLDRNSGEINAHYLRAVALLGTKAFAEAESEISKVRVESPSTLYVSGCIALEQGMAATARTLFSRYKQAVPGDLAVAQLLARLEGSAAPSSAGPAVAIRERLGMVAGRRQVAYPRVGRVDEGAVDLLKSAYAPGAPVACGPQGSGSAALQ